MITSFETVSVGFVFFLLWREQGRDSDFPCHACKEGSEGFLGHACSLFTTSLLCGDEQVSVLADEPAVSEGCERSAAAWVRASLVFSRIKREK